jgi:hypothetical protein
LKLDPCLSPCTNINSQWIKDLNIRQETYVQESIGNTLEHIGKGNNFLNRTPIAQQLKKDWQMGWQETKKLLSVQQRKQSPDWRGRPQKGRKSLPASERD